MTPILGRVGDMMGKERVFVGTLVALAVGSLLAAVASYDRGTDRRPGDPGRRRRHGAARLRDHPGRVPGREGQRRGGRAGLADRGRGRARHRPGRPDRRRAGLPLAVLAADDPDGRRRGGARCWSSPSRRCGRPGRISWLPAVLLSAWLVALLVSLSEAPEWGWGSGRILGLLAAAVVLAGAWVAGRAAGGHPRDRHADDAADGGVDEQPGRAAGRRRHVRDLRVPARVRADPLRGRATASGPASPGPA